MAGVVVLTFQASPVRVGDNPLVGNCLEFVAMAQIPASRAAVFINLVPVIAVVLGWSLLGESLSLGQAGGAFVVRCGVLVSQNK